MRVAYERPPMWALINAEFHVERCPGVIFCWGDTIYAPGKPAISRALHAHEEVHSERQLNYARPDAVPPTHADHVEQHVAHSDCCWDPVTAWWLRYIADKAFRLQEEFPAHVAEYRAYCKRHSRGVHGRYLTEVARKLASPLYGNLVTPAIAREAILTGRLEAIDGR